MKHNNEVAVCKMGEQEKYKQLSSDTRAIDWKNTVIFSIIEDVIETNKQHN